MRIQKQVDEQRLDRSIDQADRLVDPTKQQRPGIRRDLSAVESDHNGASGHPLTPHFVRDTLNFTTIGRPRCSSSVRNPG